MKIRKIIAIFSLIISVFSLIVLGATITHSSKITTHAEEITYEEPDYISIGDLKSGGKLVGNKVIMDKHRTFTYDKSAAHGSVVFSFVYKNTNWKVDDDGSQFHLYNTWQRDGMFWLRPDAIRISYNNANGDAKYIVGKKITAGTHKVELGRLAILEDGEYTGKNYFYIKIDDTMYCEYTHENLSDDFIMNNSIFTTGTNGNALLDVNWVGNKITYISNGQIYKQETVPEDYLVKPENDPEVAGKSFLGWFDEMGRQWDFDNDVVTGDMTLRAGFKNEGEIIPDEEYFSDESYKPVLRFLVSSDVHIGNSASVRDTNLANAISQAYAMANSNANYKNLDAALFAGDISDGGSVTELSSFKTTATSNLKSGTQLIASMGNHDFRGSSTAQDSITQFENLFGSADKHLVINGYHFVVLSPDISNGEHFSEAKVTWLDAELAKAQEADPTKPIFVMQHEHIYGTVYGSEAWYVTELTDVLLKYPQVVDFSGHSHYPLADPRSIWQGTFTAFGTGTLHYFELGINGYKNTGIFPANRTGDWSTGAGSNSWAAEFQIVEIDANNAMRVIAYDLISQSEIGRHYFRNLMDDIKFDYSHNERKNNSEAPVFKSSNDVELTVDKINVEVKINQATCKDVVESYRIEVYEGDKLVRTEYSLSDYFRLPVPDKIIHTIKKLKSDTEYTIKVYAVNAWNIESEPIVKNIRTELFEYPPEKYAVYDTINVLDIAYPDNDGILEDIPSESKQFDYPGTSPNYGSIMKFYLITGDINPSDEFRIQIGNVWKYYNTLWIQKDRQDIIFLGWIYSGRTTDRYKFTTLSNHIYKVEFGTVLVEQGEHEGEGFTYLKIDDVTIGSFYFPAEEFKTDVYKIAMHLSDNYRIADMSLARNIEYYVDDQKYTEAFAISGLNIEAPEAPDKVGYYFAGWYTKPTGGDRVDFRNVFTSDEKTVKYYARFTDVTHNLRFYQDGRLINTQVVGDDCQAIKPVDPIKKGQYTYVFDKWVIKGTNEEFDFSTAILNDIELEAVFKEKEYRIVYLVDGKEYQTSYYIESSPNIIIGGEPKVPALVGANGHWEYHGVRKNTDIYARAIYDGVKTTASGGITLDKYNGKKLDIADDITRFYLSFVDTEEQADWIVAYPLSGGHERQDISFSWNDTNYNSEYLVYFADNEDFKNAFIVRTDDNYIDYVGIFTPGKTYYWKVVGLTNEKFSAVDTFTILNTPVRWISSGTVFNVRDTGGWTTTDGKTVKYGMIYRGGQLSLDQDGEMSYMNDYSFKVFDYLGLKTEIELRGDKPHEYNQFNDLENLILVEGNNYMGMFSLKDSAKACYREVFSQLADKDNYPFYYHCSWGADRTGTLGFLINGLLGVPYEQLVQDYELTSFSHSGTRTRYGWSDGAFYEMYQTFLQSYANGGTLQDGITRYLISYIGVSQEDIDAIKSIMLAPLSDELTTHDVTFIIDGEIYQRSKVFDGQCIKSVTALFFDRRLDCWLLDGQPFDENTKVTKDLELVGKFVPLLYEDYDIVTVKDLGVGDNYVPTAELLSIEGTSNTGGRLLVFDYEIVASDGTFDDGVHVEIGANTWDYRAHIWIADQKSIHIFTDGSRPVATYNRMLEYGKTYRFSVGVVIPLEGEYAGKKMFVVLIDGKILTMLPTTADIQSTYNIGIAGTEGVLHSVVNKRVVTFVSQDGKEIKSLEVDRGEYIESIKAEDKDNKVFLGWFDELGNLWNFETSKVLKDTKLFAKYGDRTIDAVVIDENGMEIQHGYQVRIGIQVSAIDIPLAPNDKLVFEGWYNGSTKLNDTDVIDENMTLICKFKVADEPVVPENPEEETKKGCKGGLTSGFGILVFALIFGAFILTKKKGKGWC